MEKTDITIVGGGVVGSAIAYRLSQNHNGVALLEKNPPPGKGRRDNQTSTNAGVIHAGIYYDPQTSPLKAKLCVEGNRKLYEFCEEHGVPHSKVGKILAATDPYGEGMLEKQLAIARANNVPDVRMIDSNEAKRKEPNVRCTKALYSGTTGIVNSVALADKMTHLSENNGAAVVYGAEVVGIEDKNRGFLVHVHDKNGREYSIETNYLINSAGLYSDEIARMADSESPHRITPIKLEFAVFRAKEGLEVNGNIYPAPYHLLKETGEVIKPTDEEIQEELGKSIEKTVGSHLTPEIGYDGSISPEITISPVSAGRAEKDDYTNTKPLKVFHDRVKAFFPNLKLEDLNNQGNPETDLGTRVGVLAEREGASDFLIEKSDKNPCLINLIGIESPGMTSCLSIADYVTDMMDR